MSALAGQRLLVTGATGFLGGGLVAHLLDQGAQVVAQGRQQSRLDQLARDGAVPLQLDLSASDAVARLARIGPVDAIIHAAARSAAAGPRHLFQRDNIAATANLLRAAHDLGAGRFVHVSSPSVAFAPRDQLDLKESDPLPRPYTHYAASKRRAEELVLSHPGLRPIVLRPRGVYGQGDAHLLPRLLTAARRGPLPLFRGGAGRIDLTHIDDVIGAVIAALRAPDDCNGRVFNISSGQVVAVRDIIECAAARAGIGVHWRAVPLRPSLWTAALLEKTWLTLRRQDEPPVTRYGLALLAYAQSLCLDQARDHLGWSPQVDFAEGLRRTFGPRDRAA